MTMNGKGQMRPEGANLETRPQESPDFTIHYLKDLNTALRAQNEELAATLLRVTQLGRAVLAKYGHD